VFSEAHLKKKLETVISKIGKLLSKWFYDHTMDSDTALKSHITEETKTNIDFITGCLIYIIKNRD
jgi:hypothetical protein